MYSQKNYFKNCTLSFEIIPQTLIPQKTHVEGSFQQQEQIHSDLSTISQSIFLMSNDGTDLEVDWLD